MMDNTTGSDILIACACPRCGSHDTRVTLRSPDRQFPSNDLFCASKCHSCGLLHQNPRIRLDLLARHYPNDYAPYTSDEIVLDQPVTWHLKQHMGYGHLPCELQPSKQQRRYGVAAARSMLIPDYCSGGTVLEFGCASGNRLALFKRLGWSSCIGNEYSDAAAAKARDRGLDVITGPVESALAQFSDGSLAAIVAGFVIEHLPDPYATTRVLASKLRSGGQFLFSTVNIECPDFWLNGKHWYNLDLPRHMTFFRPSDLRAMLAPDFEVESVSFESTLNDYQGSARYRVQDGIGGWRSLLDQLVLKSGRRLAKPLSLLARAGYGGRIYMTARKR